MQTDLFGIYRAVVVSTKDPSNKNRIRVKAPQVSGNAELQWAEPVNTASPVPSVNTVVWVMFNGGYINKPLWFPSEDNLVWTPISPITGYTQNGNLEGVTMYTSYTWRGTRYMEWQGGLNVSFTGTEGSFTVPNGGTFYQITDPSLIPSSRRTLTASKNNYSSANYVNNTIKVDFNTDGTCTLVGSSTFQTNWVSFNGFRYPL